MKKNPHPLYTGTNNTIFLQEHLKKCVCLSPLWNFIPTFSQTNKNLVLVALFWRFNIFFKNCKVWDLEQKPFVLQFIYINSVSLTEMSAPNTSCKQKTQKRALHFLFIPVFIFVYAPDDFIGCVYQEERLLLLIIDTDQCRDKPRESDVFIKRKYILK